MLDLFTIFTKGGIVLWYFQGTALSFTPAVNALIKSVILQERGGANAFNHGAVTLKFKMDNEYELMFVAVYQKILQLSYVDKLIDQVQLEFRDKYKNELATGPYQRMNFGADFENILHKLEEQARVESSLPRRMKSFEESKKADRAVLSVNKSHPETRPSEEKEVTVNGKEEEEEEEEAPGQRSVGEGGRAKALAKLGVAMRGGGRRGRGAAKKPASQSSKSASKPSKRVKEARRWDGVVSREEAAVLDHSEMSAGNGVNGGQAGGEFKPDYSLVGKMKGELKSLEVDEEEEEEEEEEKETKSAASQDKKPASSGGGVFSFFASLTRGRTITREAMDPVLEKMKEHLITKNVAAEIAEKLCNSVAAKLEGKTIGTFSGIQSTVRASMEESLFQILSPKRRINILRDVMGREKGGRPYTITFCGVNGVGKSTNLAKVAFWLMENGLRVLIAACDTFRSGAVEQLRTHTHHLNALHPAEGGLPSVSLYAKGYDKDAAGVATDAIHYAQQQHYDVVLVDTAGRMQNNEPLMRALAKLIRVNAPDLVLFVGEALVGNEAVDQLAKFNEALVDHSEEGTLRTIDGIVLTKFDTIDDKVGAAISMTYTTGQPIVFVGTGQRYTDIRSFDPPVVVSTLLK